MFVTKSRKTLFFYFIHLHLHGWYLRIECLISMLCLYMYCWIMPVLILAWFNQWMSVEIWLVMCKSIVVLVWWIKRLNGTHQTLTQSQLFVKGGCSTTLWIAKRGLLVYLNDVSSNHFIKLKLNCKQETICCSVLAINGPEYIKQT